MFEVIKVSKEIQKWGNLSLNQKYVISIFFRGTEDQCSWFCLRKHGGSTSFVIKGKTKYLPYVTTPTS